MQKNLQDRYKFVCWSLEEGINTIDEATVIKQIGVLNEGEAKNFSAVNGTVNGRDSISTPYINDKLTLNAADGSIWTRTVDGIEYLASYDPSFVAFSSNEDVVFTAYDPSNLHFLQVFMSHFHYTQCSNSTPLTRNTLKKEKAKIILVCRKALIF